ncbi:Uncharacterized protein FWK35_00036288, partial [Aphis craccivora]
YSDTIITVNQNTDCPAEECLVDCLSAVTINEAEVNPVNELTELEKDCIEYVTGYVASRYAIKYPWLCNKESIIIIFNDFHGKDFINKEPKVMTKVNNLLMHELQKENLHLPVKVVEC